MVRPPATQPIEPPSSLVRRLWTAFVRALTVGAGILGVALLAYIPYVVWEISRLIDLCGEIRPGLEVKALPRLVEKYGFDPRWVVTRGYTDKQGNRNVFVPTNSSVGEYGCEVVHDGDKIISATERR